MSILRLSGQYSNPEISPVRHRTVIPHGRLVAQNHDLRLVFDIISRCNVHVFVLVLTARRMHWKNEKTSMWKKHNEDVMGYISQDEEDAKK